MSLSAKHARFVSEYLIDANGTRAATAAGYSAGNARKQASRMLRHPEVQAELDARRAVIEQQTGFTIAKVDRIVNDLLDHHDRVRRVTFKELTDERGRVRPMHELTDHQAAAIGALDVDEIGVEGVVIGQAKKLKLTDSAKELRHVADLAYKRMGVMRDTARINMGGVYTLVLADESDIPDVLARTDASLPSRPRAVPRAQFSDSLTMVPAVDPPAPIDRTPDIFGFGESAGPRGALPPYRIED